MSMHWSIDAWDGGGLGVKVENRDDDPNTDSVEISMGFATPDLFHEFRRVALGLSDKKIKQISGDNPFYAYFCSLSRSQMKELCYRVIDEINRDESFQKGEKNAWSR